MFLHSTYNRPWLYYGHMMFKGTVESQYIRQPHTSFGERSTSFANPRRKHPPPLIAQDRPSAYKMQSGKSNLAESSNLLFKPPKSKIHAVYFRILRKPTRIREKEREKTIWIYLALYTLWSKNINTSIWPVLLWPPKLCKKKGTEWF